MYQLLPLTLSFLLSFSVVSQTIIRGKWYMLQVINHWSGYCSRKRNRRKTVTNRYGNVYIETTGANCTLVVSYIGLTGTGGLFYRQREG